MVPWALWFPWVRGFVPSLLHSSIGPLVDCSVDWKNFLFNRHEQLFAQSTGKCHAQTNTAEPTLLRPLTLHSQPFATRGLVTDPSRLSVRERERVERVERRGDEEEVALKTRIGGTEGWGTCVLMVMAQHMTVMAQHRAASISWHLQICRFVTIISSGSVGQEIITSKKKRSLRHTLMIYCSRTSCGIMARSWSLLLLQRAAAKGQRPA